MKRRFLPRNLLIESQKFRAKGLEVLREQQRLRKLSKTHFLNNDRHKANEFTGKAHSLATLVADYNKEAAALCFKYYNSNLNRNSVDLHGLTCDESRYYLGEYMKYLISTNQSFFDVYVGLGNNSLGIPKLGRTLYNFCHSLDIFCENVEPGRWVVNMNKKFINNNDSING